MYNTALAFRKCFLYLQLVKQLVCSHTMLFDSSCRHLQASHKKNLSAVPLPSCSSCSRGKKSLVCYAFFRANGQYLWHISLWSFTFYRGHLSGCTPSGGYTF